MPTAPTPKPVLRAGQNLHLLRLHECNGGKWEQNAAAIIKNDGTRTKTCKTLQEAVTEFLQDSSSNTYIKMLHSTTANINTANINTDKNLYL